MLGIGQYGCRRCGHGSIVERDAADSRVSCGALPPYSVTHIRPEIVGGGTEQWFVMGTVDGDPRDRSGPVAICEYEPSAHVIAALLNASGGRVFPPEAGQS